MKKVIVYDKRAVKELNEFSIGVKRDFASLIETLSNEGRLDLPRAKRINKELFEIRVKNEGEYRGLYAYVMDNRILILLFFQKKTQKTPDKFIKTSIKRLQKYEI